MAEVHLGFISLESSQRPFYPDWLHDLRGKPGGELLPFYATKLGTIEMTSTNYRIPSPSETSRWAEWLPPGFVLHVKIFGLFSFGSCPRSALPSAAQAQVCSGVDQVQLRQMRPSALREVWRSFRAALGPLLERGKLGVVLSQFTARFRPGQDAFKRLRDICAQISPTRLACEFRSPEWGASEEAAALLDSLGIVVVLTDDNGSYNENNNFRELPERLRGRNLGYCRIHRRPLNRETGLICESVTEEDIAASEAPDPHTGLCSGDLRPEEVSEWAALLHRGCAGMTKGGRIYVLFSTVGRNASADNVGRMRAALGDLAAPWGADAPVPGATSAAACGGGGGAAALGADASPAATCSRRWSHGKAAQGEPAALKGSGQAGAPHPPDGSRGVGYGDQGEQASQSGVDDKPGARASRWGRGLRGSAGAAPQQKQASPGHE